MKLNKSTFLKCMFVLSSQFGFSQAPSIEWQNSYWAKTYPTSPQQPTPPPGFAGVIAQDSSSEDWFYAHSISKGSNNQPNGYICGGYSTFINYGEFDNTGCMTAGVFNPAQFDCNELERYGYKKGGSKVVLSLVDLNGNTVWYKTYSAGAVQAVIQTSDGGYLGLSASSSTENGHGALVAYNPTTGHTSNYFIRANYDTLGKSKLHLTKVNASGTVQWEYLYGIVPYSGNGAGAYRNETYTSGGSGGAGLIETSTGNFMFTAGGTDPVSGEQRTCVIEVDHNGMWKWGKLYGYTDSVSIGGAITKTGTGVNERFFIAGTQDIGGSFQDGVQKAFVFKINDTLGSQHIPIWTAYHYQTLTNNNGAKAGSSLAINTAGELLVPVMVNILYRWTGERGNGFVYRVDPNTGADISYTDFGTIVAYDLTIGVTATADGGFAAVSSKQLVYPSYFPSTSTDGTGCTYGTRIHQECGGTDGYVAKCHADGSLDWDETFDSNTHRPPGDPTTWPYPDVQMRDIRRQECLYTIVQSPDGGFVVAGNNSENFDDCYLVKLASVCTHQTLSNIILNTNRRSYVYRASDYITASTVEILSGPGEVHFIAGNQIQLLPGFIANTGANFLAYIDPSQDCTPNGYRKSTGSERDLTNELSRKTDRNALNIFPNPTNGIFTVLADGEGLKSIYIYNLIGDLIFEKVSSADNRFNVDITDKPKGLYFVKVLEGNTMKTGKIISQ